MIQNKHVVFAIHTYEEPAVLDLPDYRKFLFYTKNCREAPINVLSWNVLSQIGRLTVENYIHLVIEQAACIFNQESGV